MPTNEQPATDRVTDENLTYALEYFAPKDGFSPRPAMALYEIAYQALRELQCLRSPGEPSVEPIEVSAGGRSLLHIDFDAGQRFEVWKIGGIQFVALDVVRALMKPSSEPSGDAARLDWLAAHWYDNTIGRDPDGWFTYGKKTIEKIYAHRDLREAIDSAMGSDSTLTKVGDDHG